MDNGLTLCSVPCEIQPSLVLDTPKTLAWSFAVAGARGKGLLHTELSPASAQMWCSVPLLVAHEKLAGNLVLLPARCSWLLDCVHKKRNIIKVLLSVSGCHRMWHIYDRGKKAQEPRVRSQLT